VFVRGGAIGVHREVVRAFHASPAACGGRRGGASALLKKSKRRKKKKRRKDDDSNKPFNPYTMVGGLYRGYALNGYTILQQGASEHASVDRVVG
jgi:hypothetical protein